MNRRAFSLILSGFAAPAVRPTAAPLSGLTTFSSIGKEERPFGGGTEAELLSHKGRGCRTHMWFGGSLEVYELVHILTNVDGERKASIDMELGMGHGRGFANPAAPWGNKYFGKTGAPSGIYNFYRVPFGVGVRVNAQLPQGVKDDQVFWWITRGVSMRTQH